MFVSERLALDVQCIQFSVNPSIPFFGHQALQLYEGVGLMGRCHSLKPLKLEVYQAIVSQDSPVQHLGAVTLSGQSQRLPLGKQTADILPC